MASASLDDTCRIWLQSHLPNCLVVLSHWFMTVSYFVYDFCLPMEVTVKTVSKENPRTTSLRTPSSFVSWNWESAHSSLTCGRRCCPFSALAGALVCPGWNVSINITMGMRLMRKGGWMEGWRDGGMDGWIMMEETKPVMMVMMDEQEYEYDKKDEHTMKMKIGWRL